MNRGIEVLSPASYLQYSNWLFQESKGTRWTPEENKQFEKALALFDKDTPDKWLKVASMVPGKTVGDVIKHYKELEEDVSDIEAGLFPIPGYESSSFTLEWVSSGGRGGGGGDGDDGRLDGLKNLYATCGKRGTSTRPSEQERRKGVPWTEEEHRQFLMGLKKYGKGDWRNISRYFVTTRNPTQVASHAQKYFIRQLSGGKDKRRSSIHDITTNHVPDGNPPSPTTSSLENPPASTTITITKLEPPNNQHENRQKTGTGIFGWQQPSQVTNGTVVSEPSLFHGAPSSFGYKFQEQNFLEGVLINSQFGGCNSLFQLHHPN
ncbi:hypothetical protein SAY87_012242 [Trapa incisa]|uniref:Uncharacterized protein n=1 Tax=Trapa incisa TaxID=236973 RepID=A0AAN7JJK7_9MYRT|nr:hypothetical protein SAY87_012242 [Trapa incisa]